jgi:hypothetical protein
MRYLPICVGIGAASGWTTGGAETVATDDID